MFFGTWLKTTLIKPIWRNTSKRSSQRGMYCIGWELLGSTCCRLWNKDKRIFNWQSNAKLLDIWQTSQGNRDAAKLTYITCYAHGKKGPRPSQNFTTERFGCRQRFFALWSKSLGCRWCFLFPFPTQLTFSQIAGVLSSLGNISVNNPFRVLKTQKFRTRPDAKPVVGNWVSFAYKLRSFAVQTLVLLILSLWLQRVISI